MFGRPDGQDLIWKSQRSVHGQARVKSWKLLESCGVYIITFITTQMILLVKRIYPLSRFTLDQMLNTESLDTCAALTRRVEHLKHDKMAQNLEIAKLKTRVKKLERANKVKTLKLRRLRKVGTSQRVDTLDDTLMEDVSNQRRIIDELDKDEGAVLMNEKEETKKVRDNTGDAQVEGRQADIYQIDMDHVAKVLSMLEDESEVHEAVEVVTTAKLITEVVASVIKVVVPSTTQRRGVIIRDPEEESSAQTPTETKSKDKGKGQINANMEFLLKSKEQIEEEANRAIESINETPAQKAAKKKRRNEEVKDVEEIKQHLEIVPDENDDSQRSVHGQARVKSWKLLESCGVHIITFITTQMILLVKRIYPLSRTKDLSGNTLTLNHKLDELIESLKSLPKETNKEDLAKHTFHEQRDLGFENANFKSQTRPSFYVYTPLVTYPKEVEDTIRISMEVEPFDQTQLEDVGLNTCCHDLFLSSREAPSVVELEP
nr:hypothetical protein [Tanacetum cinerariifolium]